jgi:hypothetical protein
MNTRTFAITAGVIYLLVGILGFVPGAVAAPPADAPNMAVHHNYGYLLGLFPVNTPHNLVHLLIGVWGIASYKTWGAAKSFAAGLAILYALLAVAGIIPGLNTTFGLIPLWGHDIWLHALTALVAGYFAWGVRRPVTTTAA